ncbi:hypothetical protein [Paenibacillus apiarius]|uniref:hypothetical protein n=1 Tax=Paenibacillus apiarius TaxID=46240 RepID=UPI003B3AA2D7
MNSHKRLSKKKSEKMLIEYTRGRIFLEYTHEEIFQLGMKEALNIAGITVRGIIDSKESEQNE